MSYDPLIMWQIKNRIYPLLQGLLPSNLTGWWHIMKETHSWCRMTLWFCYCLRSNLNLNILSSSRSMTIKHGGLVTYGERNPSMESLDPLTTWWCVVTWQIKSVIYSLWQGLCPWNLASWWLVVRWTHSWSHMAVWPPGHMRSPDKLKTKYFLLQKTYGHKTLQGTDVWWSKVHNEVAQLWSYDRKRSRIRFKT